MKFNHAISDDVSLSNLAVTWTDDDGGEYLIELYIDWLGDYGSSPITAGTVIELTNNAPDPENQVLPDDAQLDFNFD